MEQASNRGVRWERDTIYWRCDKSREGWLGVCRALTTDDWQVLLPYLG